MENVRSEYRNFVRNVYEFLLPTLHVCFPIWVTFCVRNLYLMLLSVFEFRTNLQRSHRIFLTGLNEIACVYRETAWHFEYKECILISDNVYHLQFCFITVQKAALVMVLR